MPFIFTQLEIEGLVLVQPKSFQDERGFFLETYKETEFHKAGITSVFRQDNHSLSKKGVVRGLHYQLDPMSQGKLVRVIKGRVFDYAVDVRAYSPTFKQWVKVELSEENQTMLYIPRGFAHGFIALTDDVHLAYKCTEEYSKVSEAGIRYDDPDLAIDWGIDHPIVSSKDIDLPYLKDARLFTEKNK
jgi:dTDP-4-dehydrorhamnose 3,5-epimerase